MEKLLIINPGSTSTKIAVYEDEKQLFVENINHDSETLTKFSEIMDQYEFRRDLIYKTVEEKGVSLDQLTAVVSRGGLLPPIEAGAYRVNEDMVWQLRNKPQNEHASNLGAVIAFDISTKYDIPAFIYDGVTVDEMLPLLKITGLPEMRRKGLGHNLNMRAAAMRYAKEHDKEYKDCSLIVAHLGGGISVSLHEDGRVADIVSDEEGPFSPERTGGLPLFQVIDMATSGKYDKKSLMKMVKNKGGFVAYFGTTDTREVEKMMKDGDKKAEMVYKAMTLNIAKHIASEAAVVNGNVEAVILTGGIAYSETFTGMIAERVKFIAPVIVYPGENEMESLALGGLRVLRGKEMAKEFHRSE
ncbi:butyrate kinase [Parasporobacterium paucivorans]|uniref:Probable butyrate kinase n=1 Tax=Parasporobacterium paucivorans DSM 15970 TaxID=1122934 RepID=A0A1M6FBX9_9FIRM|nr:butyrate kinase [Parasporobacterium paucivorans]SHI95161.1 butyrate kinase [Parasporobacterium paucivorans DSM 15970]